MAAPIGSNIGESLEAMGDAMVDLLLVRVRLGIRLADTFCDNAWVAFGVASVLAVFALHAR